MLVHSLGFFSNFAIMKLKHLLSAISILTAVLAFSPVAMGANANDDDDDDAIKFTVVIDPGHGGKDIGCKGKVACEKDITLKVAKLLGSKIEKELSDEVEVVYTRSTDKYLTLQQRADVANDARGDLFISIHVNSIDKKSRNRTKIEGTSVYTCGLHKTDNNLSVAMRENSVIELEPDYTTVYQGFDPASSESYIIFELTQNRHMRQSVDFASAAQSKLVEVAGRVDKDVRQAGFWVLWATSMPAVLVELDFICNPKQETFLNSSKGQEKCAEALYQAFREYYTKTKHHNDA